MRKSKKELREQQEAQSRVVRQMLTEYTFGPDPFHTHEWAGRLTQFALRVICKADPAARFVVLVRWPRPDVDPYHSRWSAISPPGRESLVPLVIQAARVHLAQSYAQKWREQEASTTALPTPNAGQ